MPSNSANSINVNENFNHSLSLQQISCVRGNTTLFSGLNLEASSGNLIHIRGENGSGKTSLLRIIAGIASPEDGRVLWNDQPLKKSESFANDIAYLAHRDGIKLEMTTLQNLRFYQQLLSSSNESELQNILETLDIKHIAFSLAKDLSFGQKRRVGFARLLLSSAKLWLLDEPFTGIDIAGRKLLENICLNFLDQGGTIIMTHHAEIENSLLSKKLSFLELSDYNKMNQPSTKAETLA